MALNRKDARPLHEQVVIDLRRRIAAGEFRSGDRLPSLKALRAEYDVAELTVHTAIRELQRQGVVVSSSGRGTFVAEDGESLAAASKAGEGLDELRTEVDDLRRRVEEVERRQNEPSG
ncbi:MAG: GntR family transcriptional regulator [Pseudonocardiaceae bacterium]